MACTGRPWWEQLCHPEDVGIAHDAWKRIVREKKSQNFEHRLQKPWIAADDVNGTPMTGDTWVSVILYPEVSSDGNVESVLGWVHEISLQKYTQAMQERRLKEAIDAERQKEQYIDRYVSKVYFLSVICPSRQRAAFATRSSRIPIGSRLMLKNPRSTPARFAGICN